MTIPPLIALADGRRPRLRKMPTVRPKEIVLHMATAKVLREYLRPEWRATHIPNGEVRDKRTAGKLKQMGTRPGWPDFVLVPPHGQLHCLELKRTGEKLTDEQESFRLWCIGNGVPHVVAFSINEVLVAFQTWGCLRIQLSGKEAQLVVP